MGTAYKKGLILYRQRRFSLAAREFKEEISVNPKLPMAYAMLALCLLYDKRVSDAATATRTALEFGPNCAFAHYVMAHVEVGVPRNRRVFFLCSKKGQNQVRTRRNRLRKTREWMLGAVRLSPNNPEFLAGLSAIEGDLQRWRASLTSAELGLQFNPQHVACTLMRVRALNNLRRTGEAFATVSGALQTNPEGHAEHSTQAWLFLQEDRPHPAKRHFLEALRLQPDNRRAAVGLFHARVACAVPPYGWMLAGLMWLRRGKLMFFALMLLALFGYVVSELVIPARDVVDSNEFMQGLWGDALRTLLVLLLTLLQVLFIPPILRSIFLAGYALIAGIKTRTSLATVENRDD